MMSTYTYHGQYSYAQIWYSVPTTAEQLNLITEYVVYSFLKKWFVFKH